MIANMPPGMDEVWGRSLDKGIWFRNPIIALTAVEQAEMETTNSRFSIEWDW
jgi:hypothetical protein